MSQQQGPVIFNGRYELHRRLGRGGMAEVYLARDQMLDRAVAVKVLFPALATDPGFVERFRREAQSAAGLNHPNIVGVYDWGEANGTYFIVMEYVEGESLAEMIQSQGRVDPDRAAEIASDIAAALGFAHRNGGVIHRDVKPGNVLITPDGAVKVADFGIARAISDSSDQNLTKTGSVMGTATYFSPEQARGAGVDPRSDVYSLGCVIYEMVTGRPPFQGDNAVAIAYKHVQEAPVSPRLIDPAIPDTLEAITLKCLAKNPANRYPSAQDLRADLTRYLQGARIMAEPVMAQAGDPDATSLMAPTGYNQTVAGAPATSWDNNGYGDQWNEYPDGYDDEEPPKSNRAFLAVLVLLVLLLGGVLFFAARAMSGDDDNSTTQVAVPDVLNKPQAEAEGLLTDAGLVPEVKVETSDREPGIVLKASPTPGTDVDEGSTVTLTVSGGTETIPVPDVRNKTEEQARAELEPNFIVTVTPSPSNEVPEGTVMAQDPAPGTQLEPQGTVTLTVSSGADTVAVPPVAGQSFDQAKAALEGVGFTVERRDEPNNTVASGTVIGTEPGAGAQAAPNSNVVVIVSTGADKVTVEDVEDLDQAAAESVLRGQGLNVVVETSSVDRPNQDGKVINQSPDGGSEVDAGTTVTLIVGVFRDTETTTTTSTTITLPPFP
ncbi:MAG TPA: Stk1 family PASTA domain-containing Ser/Thr kinase [Acidimicrobiales bacterium]|nr:Stk1 family PASTA domain-containing Ser/Thr kinase [Acidimicrobiales bacterium]